MVWIEPSSRDGEEPSCVDERGMSRSRMSVITVTLQLHFVNIDASDCDSGHSRYGPLYCNYVMTRSSS